MMPFVGADDQSERDLTEETLALMILQFKPMQCFRLFPLCKFTAVGAFEQVCTKWQTKPEASQRRRSTGLVQAMLTSP